MRLPACVLLGGLLVASGCGDPGRAYDLEPDGTSVTRLAVHPTAPDTVVAVHVHKPERTTDGGATWRVDLTHDVSDVAFSSSGASVVAYATTTGSSSAAPVVVKSLDGGLTFAPAGAFPGLGAGGSSLESAVGVDPNDPAHVVASVVVPSSGVPRIYSSVDSGMTWSSGSITGVSFSGAARRVAIDPLRANTAYAAYDRALVRTLDGGATWAAIAPPVTSTTVTDVALAPVGSASTLLAATSEGLFSSTDQGASWTKTPAGTGARSVAISPTDARTWIVATSRGIERSTDAGATFTLQSTARPNRIAIARSSSSVLYTDLLESFRTLDLGATFTKRALFDYAPLVKQNF